MIPFYAFGDSFTTGTGASSSNFAYINRLARKLDTTVTNKAVAGRASWEATRQALALNTLNRTALFTWMASFNDVYRGGSNPKTIEKIKGELRAFLANAFLASATPAASGAGRLYLRQGQPSTQWAWKVQRGDGIDSFLFIHW